MSDERTTKLFVALGGVIPSAYAPHEDHDEPPQITKGINTPINQAEADEIDFAVRDLDPYNVEDLLSSCMTRVANCISLREKAHELQDKFLCESLELINAPDLETLKVGIEELIWPSFDDAKAKTLHTDRTSLKDKTLALIKARTDLRNVPDSGSNYGERFDFLKKMFRKSLLQAIARAKVISRAMPRIYSVKLPELPALDAANYLNELALWLQSTADVLDLERDLRFPIKIVFALTGDTDGVGEDSFLTQAEYTNQFNDGTFRIELTEAFFAASGAHQPLLRDFCLRAVVKNGSSDELNHGFTTWITPPRPALLSESRTFYHAAMVGGLDVCGTQSAAARVYNLNPIGAWEIRFRNRSIRHASFNRDKLANFYVHMTVYGRA